VSESTVSTEEGTYTGAPYEEREAPTRPAPVPEYTAEDDPGAPYEAKVPYEEPPLGNSEADSTYNGAPYEQPVIPGLESVEPLHAKQARAHVKATAPGSGAGE
jgi:hypothetical protein